MRRRSRLPFLLLVLLALVTNRELPIYLHNHEQVEVVVGLKLQQKDKLEALLADQSNPNSPEFRKFLSASEAAARFSPTPAQYNQVLSYFQGEGLEVTHTTTNRMFVAVKGPRITVAASLESGTGRSSMQEDPSGSGSQPDHRAAVLGTLQGIMGLNDDKQVRSPAGHAVFRVLESGPVGLMPQELATVYNFPSPLNLRKSTQPRFTGKGVAIGIITCFTYHDSQIQTYLRQYGIKRTGTITSIPVGGTTTATSNETTLDIDQSASQAPGADILVYTSPTASLKTLTLVTNQAVSDNQASVLSLCWGLCEPQMDPTQIQAQHNIFMLAAVQGITVLSASGDNGANDCDHKPEKAVDFPSSEPYAVAVGGTALVLNLRNDRVAETAWTGSGGGISTIFERPAWQVGPGVPPGKMRVLSDLALVASPLTPGFALYYDNKWEVAGGTSFSTPVVAGLVAQAIEAVGQRLGHLNPALYRIANSPEYNTVFHDITAGDNNNIGGPGSGYKAGVGWDYPTGWGVLDGAAFVDWLQRDGHKPAGKAR